VQSVLRCPAPVGRSPARAGDSSFGLAFQLIPNFRRRPIVRRSFQLTSDPHRLSDSVASPCVYRQLALAIDPPAQPSGDRRLASPITFGLRFRIDPRPSPPADPPALPSNGISSLRHRSVARLNLPASRRLSPAIGLRVPPSNLNLRLSSVSHPVASLSGGCAACAVHPPSNSACRCDLRIIVV
jgi:hypothetical protein